MDGNMQMEKTIIGLHNLEKKASSLDTWKRIDTDPSFLMMAQRSPHITVLSPNMFFCRSVQGSNDPET